MKLKEPEIVCFTNPNYKDGYPFKMKLIWDRRINEYVLSFWGIHSNFTVETTKDMLKILEKANKDGKNNN